MSNLAQFAYTQPNSGAIAHADCDGHDGTIAHVLTDTAANRAASGNPRPDRRSTPCGDRPAENRQWR